jgi:hypothetical protein
MRSGNASRGSCWVHDEVGALSQICQPVIVCRILSAIECGAVNRVCSTAQPRSLYGLGYYDLLDR